MLESNDVDYIADPSYVTLEMNQVSQYWTLNSDGNPSPQRNKTSFSYEKCGTNFNYHDQSEVRDFIFIMHIGYTSWNRVFLLSYYQRILSFWCFCITQF